MTHFLLHHADINLTAEARWLLLQWERRLGLEEGFTGTLQALYEALGMTYAQGRRAWKSVVSAEVMEGESVDASPRRGRSRKRYAMVASFREQWRAADMDRRGSDTAVPDEDDTERADAIHGPEIRELMDPVAGTDEERATDNLMTGEQRKQHLMLTNRWLLMVLLAHAKVPGIVTELSYAAMQRLTGMSVSGLKSQLQKLQQLGAIADYQPGQKGVVLGKRMTSIYQLNLACPLLGKPDSEIVALFFPTTRDNHRVTLLHDFVDALAAYGTCLREEERLLVSYNRLHSASAGETLDEPVTKVPVDSPQYLKKKEMLDRQRVKMKKVRSFAEDFLQPLALSEPVIKAMASISDASTLDWLRVHVHAEAMYLLTTQWPTLGDADSLPDAPDPDDVSEAAFCHHLAYPLANLLFMQLNRMIRQSQDSELDVLYFTLTKENDNESGSKLLAWVVRGFVHRTSGVAQPVIDVVNSTPAPCDFRAYWQAHRRSPQPTPSA